MPGARGRATVAVALAAALFAIAGCGGDDGGGGGIPQDSADSMLAAAEEIEAANAEGDCETAQTRTTDLRNEVEQLGDGQTKRALDAMVTRLDENLDSECTDSGTSDPETEPDPVEEEVPVEPAPVPEEEPAPEEEAPPPDEDEEPATPEQPQGEGGGPNGPPQTPPGQSGGGGGAPPPTGGVDEG